jgi:hypothetical protein
MPTAGDLFQKRLRFMTNWATYCASAINRDSAVIDIKQAI